MAEFRRTPRALQLTGRWHNNLTTLDGLAALALGVLHPFWIYMCITYSIGAGLSPSKESLPALLFALASNLPAVIFVLVLLRVRGQSLESIGLSTGKFSKDRFGILCVVLVGIVSLLLGLRGWNWITAYYAVFYFIIVGFMEEFVYRGFIHPRLAGWLGFWPGFIISGMMFGIAHAPQAIVIYSATPSTAVFNNIGNGIVGHAAFLLLYAFKGTLLIPAFIHGLLDFLGQLA